MRGWMRTHFDFGLPYKTFVVGEYALCAKCPNMSVAAAGAEKVDPEAAAELIRKIVLVFRPELVGCTVVGFGSRTCGLWWITVVHGSFPRVDLGTVPDDESLELCPACWKPLPIGGKLWARAAGDVVCSEACSKVPVPRSQDGHGMGHVEQCPACKGAMFSSSLLTRRIYWFREDGSPEHRLERVCSDACAKDVRQATPTVIQRACTGLTQVLGVERVADAVDDERAAMLEFFKRG